VKVRYQLFEASREFSLPPDFTFNDQPLSSEASFRRTRYSDRLFYTDEQTEFNILLTSLAASNDIPLRVQKTESPDFKVDFVNERRVYVEITNAIESREARADQKVSDMSYGLSNWALTDNEASARLQGYNLAFFMPEPPSKKDEEATFEDLKRFTLAEDLSALAAQKIQKISNAYPHLHNLEVKFYCAQSRVTSIQVTRGAMSVEAPWDATRVVYDAIARKRRSAQNWPRPLWLIVWISGHYYNPQAMIESLVSKPLEIEPFERVYVGGGNPILVASAEPHN